MTTKNKEILIIEYGDYQTPFGFAESVCAKLKKAYSLTPTVIIEPTFGTGNFIENAVFEFETINNVYGIELNENYYSMAKERLDRKEINAQIELHNADIFSFDFSEIKDSISKDDNILIIGNPPWATNTKLSSLYSYNLPLKENFKGCSGLDAITGKGNFDIAEYIILQMLSEFSDYNCTLAMLCKTIVAKNIIRDTEKYEFNISKADMYVFNANDVFNVSCDAALFVVKIGKNNTSVCNVFDFYTDSRTRQFGWQNNFFYSDIPTDDTVMNIDGKCPFEWRQGVKHDCSKVMELTHIKDSEFVNGLDKTVHLNIGQFVFPLLKSSDIKSNEISKTRKHVIITQRAVNTDTSVIKNIDENVWDYLIEHNDLLNARRSVIYKKAPKYSIFGIGDYSFAKYKVGISGFYKEPIFAFITSEHPIMLDDTCYFLSFNNATEAIITTALLNNPICLSFLKSIAFLDSKRPYTKEVLKRIDLLKLSEVTPYSYICNFANSMKGEYSITANEYNDFIESISNGQLSFNLSIQYTAPTKIIEAVI